ncbi:MAG TPA: DNA repair protein RecN [Flammeovirgaceae bacterium]|nr:DNA repair protein RecN [Flammeovirgaceae bacterium]
MLSRLTIANYALITSLDLAFDTRLNIITGETGAGKSIMLGAVGLLLGKRADTRVLYDKDRKCVIEGEFDIAAYGLQDFFKQHDLDYETATLIRREITPAGKSRAFINDTPVTLDILKELGSRLMDIHSQHQTLLLGQAGYQLQIIDVFAGTAGLAATYREQYQAWQQARQQLAELQDKAGRLQQERDFNEFLLNELEEANLQADEQEHLEEELRLLEHAEEIKTSLTGVLALLDHQEINTLALLAEARQMLTQVSDYGESLAALLERLESARLELADLAREVEQQEQLVEVDFGRAEEVRQRLSLIYHLQNKHHVPDIAGLLAIRDKLAEETFLAGHLDEQINTMQARVEDTHAAMLATANELSRQRQAVFADFERQIVALLQQLGMPQASLAVERSEQDPGPLGIDKIVIAFSANKGVAPAPIHKVASGGELSRLMFCIKYVMADKTALPTMVFDEVDAGVSGEIALQMGKMMQQMAAGHQVIAISHLPQIAAKGQAHYYVYKAIDGERSVSMVRQLDEEEKITMIARMIGGDSPSENALESARELIRS